MAVALSLQDPFDLPRPRRVRTPRPVRLAAKEGVMNDSVEGARRRDEWSARIGAIAAEGDRAAFAELFAFFAQFRKSS